MTSQKSIDLISNNITRLNRITIKIDYRAGQAGRRPKISDHFTILLLHEDDFSF